MWRIKCTAIVVAAGAATLGCAAGDGADPEVPSALAATRIEVGGSPWGVAIDGSTVWVSDASRGTIIALDADSGEQQREVAIGAPDPRGAGLAVDDGALWVANLGGSVSVLNTANGDVVDRIVVGPGEPAAIALTEGDAWVPRHGLDGGLTRIPRRDVSDAVPISLPRSAFATAADDRTVWVTGLEEGLFALDSGSGEVRLEVDLPGSPRGVAVLDGDAWVTLRDRRQVVRVDGTSGEILTRVDLEGSPWPIAVGAGAIWVAELEGRLLRVDPATGRVTAAAAVGPQPRGIAVSRRAIWVTSQAGAVFLVEIG